MEALALGLDAGVDDPDDKIRAKVGFFKQTCAISSLEAKKLRGAGGVEVAEAVGEDGEDLEMASFCRLALLSSSRALAARSRTVTQKTLNAKSLASPFTSPSTRSIPQASKVHSALGSVESLMPLHSAVANARLKSSIVVDTSCWSWLSQGDGS
ncbi:hypothetical protein Tsubulata_025410 [Turnera subulata]|uniref:Uncharacterized protein n=1 Tax=Turnera subulata TaxID=218843 RepID=A0A9Q0JJU6_9ROSI|nr:hypothetical protein Tsubulata_025410 [Turnera subulata]